jgi:hypothetical protein
MSLSKSMDGLNIFMALGMPAMKESANSSFILVFTEVMD